MLQVTTWVSNNSSCKLAVDGLLQVSSCSRRHEIFGSSSCWCWWVISWMANGGHEDDHDGVAEHEDESVMRRCWYVSFSNRDDASRDAENARRSGFSFLAWRTVQPTEDLSSFQWCGYTFSCLSMVRLLQKSFSQWCGCTFSRSRKWSCSSFSIPLGLPTLFFFLCTSSKRALLLWT